MLAAAISIVLAISSGAADPPAAWEDIPAPGAHAGVATATPTPTSTATSTATATPTPTSTSTAAAPPGVASAEDAPALPAAPPGAALANAGPVLLRRVERPAGYALERLIEPDGDIVEHEVNAAGTVQSCRKVGSLGALRIVAQQPTAGGEYVEVARDASGALVQFVVASDGEPRAVTLLAPAP